MADKSHSKWQSFSFHASVAVIQHNENDEIESVNDNFEDF